MSAATRDLVNAGGYLVALGAILAASTLSYGLLVRAMPGLMRTWMPAAETSGSGADADTRYAPWRLSPQEAQRLFEARSSVLLPPTPAFPPPENGWPSYAAMARQRARDSAGAVVRPAKPDAIDEPTPAKLGAPAAKVDFQMGGR